MPEGVDPVPNAAISALILAGGRATRLGGVAKHELVVEGKTIFERQVEVLAPRVAEILVSSPRQIPGYRTVEDAIADGGPLAGIAAGLAAARTPWLLVVAGDMPYLSGAVIDALVARAPRAADAVGIEIGGKPQPLLCLLDRTTVPGALDRLLTSGERKASRLLTDAGLMVTWIGEDELRAIDPALRTLANINAPEDLAR